MARASRSRQHRIFSMTHAPAEGNFSMTLAPAEERKIKILQRIACLYIFNIFH